MLLNSIRKPFYAVVMISAILLSACGREITQNQAMSEEEAMRTLTNFPMTSDSRDVRGGRSQASADELLKMLKDMVASGEIKLSSKYRSAVGVNGTPDLSLLEKLFVLISSGQASNIFTLAKGLFNAARSASQAKFDLGLIAEIIRAAIPIVAIVAPQFSAILAAISAILPMVTAIINMFKKPTASMGFGWTPNLA